MAPEIPGYYFDPVKKKYFKIEKSHTAPPAAAWSADEVKRRRVASSAAESSRRRARLLRNHIQRHAVLEADLVTRGRLLRELGGGRGEAAAVVEDMMAAAWAGGLVDKGSIPFVPSFARERYANMPCMYVGGDDDKTGLGVAYATLDEETLVGSYIATDNNDAISFSRTAPESTGRRQGLRAEMIRCPQMSSIRYHRPSHKILLTSREPDHSCGLYFFSPLLSEEHDYRPQWLLGETSHYQRLYIRHRLRDEWLVHQSTPAPASSDLLCVIGTNAGILRVRSNETMAWISSAPSSGAATAVAATVSKHVPQEVFDQDFQTGNHNVLLAGGRQPRLWTTDLRAPAAQWRSVPHASSITHLRSISEHQVLVAGLRSSMATYDLRFLAREKPEPAGGRSSSSSTPVLRFEGYRNEAHVHTGWDVSVEMGLAAAAQDDGTVKLFSLKSGRRLTGGGALGRVRADTPIRALMFQRMPRERMSSLWVGEGPMLRKFSLGVGDVGDEA
ncbi:hypothetical protein LMH87_009614 [Akanthomyces muscarius]|uniref:Myocyte-specific enhancer factor 2d n=1 Tax=Akanthomyces muscarius TaxID=2231603 RepID=A0A9W8QF25_AKAMU|nr:hypothetical protein LMH87_009614 [Akanthomyces muscarius]KAJ4153109.1 hypothetical protein LMH87_009614 [Akanthomyces muscarius]